MDAHPTPAAPAPLRTVAAASAAVEVALLCVGIPAMLLDAAAWHPWLAQLFAINAARGDASLDSLDGITLIDVVALGLAAVTFAGFWPGAVRAQRAWIGLAVLLPLAGIAVLVATGSAGRSGLMGGGLILSVVLLRTSSFQALGYLGAGANLLLLMGDFATTGSRSLFAATATAVGYVALLAWFAGLAAMLRSRAPRVAPR